MNTSSSVQIEASAQRVWSVFTDLALESQGLKATSESRGHVAA